MIEVGFFSYTEPQWQQIREVVQRGLDRDADGIPYQGRPVVYIDGVAFGRRRTLRHRIEDVAAVHLARCAVARETPARKARIKQLTKLDKLAEALGDATDAAYDDGIIIVKGGLGPDNPGLSVIPDLTLHPNVDRDLIAKLKVDIAKLKATIAREIAALMQTPAAVNTSKADRDQFWNDVVPIWTDIGGEPTGKAAARFLIAVSEPVFDRVRAEGGSKTAASMPMHLNSVANWLQLRDADLHASGP
jgi:hypothetical protein